MNTSQVESLDQIPPVVPDAEVEVDPHTPIFNAMADDWARVQAVQAETADNVAVLAAELDDATETPIDLEAEVSDATS